MTPLRQRLIEDLQLRGFSPRTQEAYVHAVHRLAQHFHFLERADWHRRPASSVVDEHGGTSPLEALEEMRRRLRTRYYAYRTESTHHRAGSSRL